MNVEGVLTRRDFQVSAFSELGEAEKVFVLRKPHTYRKALSTATDVAVRVPQTKIAPAAEAPAVAVTAASACVRAVQTRAYELTRFAVEDGDELPDAKSLQGLLGFIQQYQPRLPLLGTDNSGRFVATWRQGQEDILTIRFVDSDRIEFAVSEGRESGKPSRDWGEARWEGFVQQSTTARHLLGI